jgi:hypothetical protein
LQKLISLVHSTGPSDHQALPNGHIDNSSKTESIGDCPTTEKHSQQAEEPTAKCWANTAAFSEAVVETKSQISGSGEAAEEQVTGNRFYFKDLI